VEVHRRTVEHDAEDVGARVTELLLGGEQLAAADPVEVDDEDDPVRRRGDRRRVGDGRHRHRGDEDVVGVVPERGE
jgi:hypothetical protein